MYLKPSGSVLDVGCGDGVLYERYCPYASGVYVGLDVSEAAVASIRVRHPNSRFFQADAETYVPTDRFDTVVFNETLYYFRDPAGILARYAATALAPTGIVIVSLYRGSRRARVITQQLRKRFTVIDATVTRQGAKTWVCLVLTFPNERC